MVPRCRNLFTTQAVHVIHFFKRKLKLPISVKIHVLLILNEITMGAVLIFFRE